jgi:hypothetical protein
MYPNDSKEFVLIPYPMIKGLIEPQGSSLLALEQIDRTRGEAFNSLGDLLQWEVRKQQNMHVVRHHHESEQVVPLRDPKQDGVHDDVCSPAISQVHRPFGRTIQVLISRSEQNPLVAQVSGV